MRKRTKSTLRSAGICLLLALAGTATAQSNDRTGKALTSRMTILPPEVSKQLELTPMPTSEPTALVFGGKWVCQEDAIGEYCQFKLVVCTDDYEVCVQTNSQPAGTLLSKKESRSLDIAAIPTSRPIPLIVGTHWDCAINSHGFEICDLKTVVCNDDQTFCTEIP